MRIFAKGKNTYTITDPLVRATFDLLDHAVALPLDDKCQLLNDLALLRFEFAEEHGLVLFHGRVRVFKDLCPEVFRTLVRITSLHVSCPMPFGTRSTWTVARHFLERKQHLVVVPERFHTAICGNGHCELF